MSWRLPLLPLYVCPRQKSRLCATRHATLSPVAPCLANRPPTRANTNVTWHQQLSPALHAVHINDTPRNGIHGPTQDAL
eukprot:10919048-Lingulodinium_polyedra.AAC.1